MASSSAKAHSVRVLRAVSEARLSVLIGLGLLARIAAGLAFPASGADLYEFGVIAGNLDAGRGYSYFAVQGSEVVIDTERTGTPLSSAFMPPAYTGAVYLATDLAGRLGTDQAGIVWLVRGINLALAAITMAGLARLVGDLASSRAARLAVLGYALYPAFVYQATQVSASNAYLAMEVLLLAVCVRLARRVTAVRVLAAAALAGVICLLRSEGLLLVAALAVWLGCFAGGPGFRRASRLRATAAFLVVSLLLPGAWLVRNSVVFDQPVLTTTTTGGLNLWIGNHPGASGSQKDHTVTASLQADVRALEPTEDYEVQLDALFRDAALQEITSNPDDTVLRSAKKVLLMVGVDLYDERSLNPVYLMAYAGLLVLGVWGMIGWSREARRAGPPDWPAYATLMGGWLLLSLAVPAVFFALARFRLPVELLLLMGAAFLLARWSERSEVRVAPHAHLRNG